jgi:hypothetical protein
VNEPLPGNKLLNTKCFVVTVTFKNQTVAWGINRRFRENKFMKYSNGTLGLGDFYSLSVEVIKGSAFVNSGGVETESESRERLIRDSSKRFVRQTSLRRGSICEPL